MNETEITTKPVILCTEASNELSWIHDEDSNDVHVTKKDGSTYTLTFPEWADAHKYAWENTREKLLERYIEKYGELE